MIDLCVAGGAEIARLMQLGFETRTKADASPVTICDEAAERIILAGLSARFPEIPVVAEEAAAAGFMPACGDLFFLVDPLDGTKEFIAGKADFTVNIALVCEGSPIAGVVYAPAMRAIWAGSRMGGKCRAAKAACSPGAPAPLFATMSEIHARTRPGAGLVALVSRSHSSPRVEEFLARLPVAARRDMGSSLKFCLLAEGEADVYPRLSPTMEWDTAAGDAVLRAAGGSTFDESGGDLRYGKSADSFRNGGFVAWGAVAP
ncbi:MAG: 3'(2'),5'-bisphosphate nucleotidase CysQ [Beijerinckiaceae bacterium]